MEITEINDSIWDLLYEVFFNLDKKRDKVPLRETVWQPILILVVKNLK